MHINTKVTSLLATLAIAAIVGCQAQQNGEAPSAADGALETDDWFLTSDGGVWWVDLYTPYNGSASATFTYRADQSAAGSSSSARFGVCLIRDTGLPCGSQNADKTWTGCTYPTGGFNYCVNSTCWVRPGDRLSYCAGTPADQQRYPGQPSMWPYYASGTTLTNPAQSVPPGTYKSYACFASDCDASADTGGSSSSSGGSSGGTDFMCNPECPWNGSYCQC